jgi:hypothetical protein
MSWWPSRRRASPSSSMRFGFIDPSDLEVSPVGDRGGIPNGAVELAEGAPHFNVCPRRVREINALSLVAPRPSRLGGQLSHPVSRGRLDSPRQGNRLFPFLEWASDSFRDGHLTHPDSVADGGLPHAQIAAREPDSGQLTLDQEIEGSNPSSPASSSYLWKPGHGRGR